MKVRIKTINPQGDEEDIVEEFSRQSTLNNYVDFLKKQGYQVIAWEVL